MAKFWSYDGRYEIKEDYVPKKAHGGMKAMTFHVKGSGELPKGLRWKDKNIGLCYELRG